MPKFIRWFLGRVILLLNFVFTPRGVKRSQEEQSQVNEQAKNAHVMQFEACPFCVKCAAMKRQSWFRFWNFVMLKTWTAPCKLEAGGGRVRKYLAYVLKRRKNWVDVRVFRHRCLLRKAVCISWLKRKSDTKNPSNEGIFYVCYLRILHLGTKTLKVIWRR